MASFSVIVLTAAPAGMAAESGGGASMAKMDGREVLLKTVELFLNREAVKQIRVVFQNEFLEEAKRKFGSHFSFSGIKVCGGGPRWIDQIVAAAAHVPPDATHVMVHDAARPVVPYTDLEALMEAAEKHSAVALAAPVRSTLVEVDEGGNPRAYRPASEFMALLTPMTFKKDAFAAMVAAKAEPHASQLTLLKASAVNVRLGGGNDVSMIKAMMNLMPKPKIKATSPFEEAQW